MNAQELIEHVAAGGDPAEVLNEGPEDWRTIQRDLERFDKALARLNPRSTEIQDLIEVLRELSDDLFAGSAEDRIVTNIKNAARRAASNVRLGRTEEKGR